MQKFFAKIFNIGCGSLSLIKKDLVFSHKSFNTKEETIAFLAGALNKKGVAKDSYQNALLEREKKFPTGLPTGDVKVAIPHADSEHVNESAIAVTTLDSPVSFKNMGDPEEDLKVSIIIMLAIAEPKAQVKMLQNLMSIVQDQNHLTKLLSYKTSNELFLDLDNTFSKIKL